MRYFIFVAFCVLATRAGAQDDLGSCLLSRQASTIKALGVNLADGDSLLQIVPQGSSIHHMESVIASQVEKAVIHGTEALSDSTEAVPTATLEAVREYLDELRKQLLVEHDADQNATDRLRRLASSCFDTMTKAETDTRQSNHENCRTRQVQLHKSRVAKCKAYSNGQAQLAAAPCVLSYVPGGTADQEEAYRSCLQKLNAWSVEVQSLWSAQLECQGATKALENQTKVCGAKQHIFEDGVCSLKGACNCHIEHTQEFMTQREQVEKAEASRRASHSATARIDCLLKMLDGNATLRNESFHKCRSMEDNTTHLSIVYHPTPSSGDACKGNGKPCDEDWLSENYKQADWYTIAPTEPCNPCPTTTLSTTIKAVGGDSNLDGGGWKLVWKHSYMQVGKVTADMKFFSQHDRPCTDLSVGWCNVPSKLAYGANQQMTMALHNDHVVYAYRGDINPELDSTWRGAILNNYVKLVDECKSSHGDPPDPEGPNGAHRLEGVTFDKANPGDYSSNCDTDRNGNGDCRWENCRPASGAHNQMTLAMFIRHKA